MALFPLSALGVLVVSEPVAQADNTCRPTLSVTYQGANTVVEHASDKANPEVLGKLREYIPSARPIDLNRMEHTFGVNYQLGLRGPFVLRLSGGLSISPESTVYRTRGAGQYDYHHDGHPLNIGDVEATMATSGHFYIAGADLLYITEGCDRPRLHLVFGAGLAAIAFDGDMNAAFDALITGGTSPDWALKGKYYGVGGQVNALVGIRYDVSDKTHVMLAGGYRLGLAYVSLKSDLIDRDGALPIAGPFVQLSAGYTF